MAESMESRIFTRTGACNSKGGGLAVSAYIYERERERERERESSKNIGMAKYFGHFLLSLNKVYMSLSVLHNCYLI